MRSPATLMAVMAMAMVFYAVPVFTNRSSSSEDGFLQAQNIPKPEGSIRMLRVPQKSPKQLKVVEACLRNMV